MRLILANTEDTWVSLDGFIAYRLVSVWNKPVIDTGDGMFVDDMPEDVVIIDAETEGNSNG